MTRVLIFADYYLPGFKAGGPINSISSICSSLSEEFDIYLVTRDRDIGDMEPYKDVVVGQWQKVRGINVMYKQTSQLGLRSISNIIREIEPSVIHFNSLLSLRFSFLPLIVLSMLKSVKAKIVLSPRGELSQAALQLKKIQKVAFLALFSFLELDKKVGWIASSDAEYNDIIREFKLNQSQIHRIDNFPNIAFWKVEKTRLSSKKEGRVQLVFCSRISKMKNLEFLLNCLKSVNVNVSLDIFGPYEDKTYLMSCKKLIEELPKNIQVEFCGAVPSHQMYGTLKEYDLFVLPTLGENFGQIIWEALASSVPVLISDRTPWQQLESSKVGWDVSLNNPDAFVGAIGTVSKMNESEHAAMRQRCRQFAIDYLDRNNSITLMKNLYTR